MSADEAPITIDLAREAAFALGALEVRPSTRELIAGGRPEVLEPRVMQVLVALARRKGQVISRDDLILSCWGGRAVSEDAINRSISVIRKLSETHGGFQVTTVTRVGYRLDEQAPPPAAKGQPALPLLAVLAFDNLSGDPDMAWFSDGVSEEIQQTVARAAELKVIGRASSFQFRGADKAAAHVASALQATHVLDGSVRRSGTQVRIAAQLVECIGQTTLWSDQFDRDLADVFNVQDEIAAAVAGALKATFAQTSPVGRIDPAAFDLYLKARFAAEESLLSAPDKIGRLQQAVSLAPQLGPAWAELAYTRAIDSRRTDGGGSSARVEITAAAERALELDPRSGLAYAALGCLLAWGDYQGRASWFAKALEASPQEPRILTQMGWLMATVGRNQDALHYASQALALDPLYSRAANIYAQMLAAVGRYDESQRAYDLSREKWPLSQVFTSTPLNLASFSGDWEGFDRLHGLAYELGVSGPHIAEALATGEMIRDPTPLRKERVRQIIRAQISRTGTVSFGPLNMAYRMGLADEVFAFVEQASFAHLKDETGPPAAAAYSPSIIFDRTSNSAMIADVRFVGFCAKLGLCDYWVETDRWPDCAGDRALTYDFKAESRRLATA